MVRQEYQLFPTRDIDGQRILGSYWFQSTPGHLTKSGSLKCYHT